MLAEHFQKHPALRSQRAKQVLNIMLTGVYDLGIGIKIIFQSETASPIFVAVWDFPFASSHEGDALGGGTFNDASCRTCGSRVDMLRALAFERLQD